MVQRYNPDYVMHAARFEPFARENEHGEFVKFSDYEVLKAERDAQQKRADALAVENAAQAAALSLISDCYKLSPHIQSMCAVETPATSAALAAIQAQGVEKAAEALDALSVQSASATTQANFRAAAVYLRAEVIPAIGEAK